MPRKNIDEYNEYMKNNKRTKTRTREEMLEKLIFLIENKNNLDFDDRDRISLDFDDWDRISIEIRILKWVLKIE